jgi:hypothetical protein
VCGTAAEVIALREIDFRMIGEGKTGPVTRALQQEFDRLVAGRHARSVPLGGRTSEPATVWGDARPDRATAGTDGINGWRSSQQRNSVYSGLGEGEVLQKRRNIRNFGGAGSDLRP